ncbi:MULTISPECIES: hypothetical protein [Hymenobacter]|uniref:Uncharacterized protein n=1 Tax=Hymenobacter jejuensis TaxID=2502781 RepID=A0A5B8A339_9BACT|nr:MULTISPECIES: hypothetical protein [Hymenobacter]MBC6990495.1 hypothetical protein [Hymenobacter sp. BT491]QDA61085.1 hypothetical protein FHG12_13660 [Hymenobacter jejuensis]
MANQPKKQSAPQQPGDPLFNLKHAQAEAELQAKTGGLGPITNVYTTSDEEDEIDRGQGPLDKQGQRRGANDPTDLSGSTAGSHK